MSCPHTAETRSRLAKDGSTRAHVAKVETNYILVDKFGVIIKLILTYEPELWHCGENVNIIKQTFNCCILVYFCV